MSKFESLLSFLKCFFPKIKYILYTVWHCLQIFLYLLGFALNSILIDERLGFTKNGYGQTPRFAIIPPSTPTLKNALIQNGYEVSFHLDVDLIDLN